MLPLLLLLLLATQPWYAGVVGLHVDEETCSGNLDTPAGPNNRSTQTRLCAGFLDQLYSESLSHSQGPQRRSTNVILPKLRSFENMEKMCNLPGILQLYPQQDSSKQAADAFR
jgi:hypothetical protein